MKMQKFMKKVNADIEQTAQDTGEFVSAVDQASIVLARLEKRQEKGKNCDGAEFLADAARDLIAITENLESAEVRFLEEMNTAESYVELETNSED